MHDREAERAFEDSPAMDRAVDAKREREAAARDKQIMRDETAPLEVRRAAFRRHNRRQQR